MCRWCENWSQYRVRVKGRVLSLCGPCTEEAVEGDDGVIVPTDEAEQKADYLADQLLSDGWRA